MSDSEKLFEAGLRAGFLDESHGILEPESGYPDGPYLAGVRRGREAWRRESAAALVVDRLPANPWNEDLTVGQGGLCA
jgi:hypothetical protein